MGGRYPWSKSAPKRLVPAWLFNALHREFRLTTEVNACYKHHLCEKRFYGDGALEASWAGERVLMVPPSNQIKRWLAKAWAEVEEGGAELVVALLPAKTSVNWWQHYVTFGAEEVRFFAGPFKFDGIPTDGVVKGISAPPMALVVFQKHTNPTRWGTIEVGKKRRAKKKQELDQLPLPFFTPPRKKEEVLKPGEVRIRTIVNSQGERREFYIDGNA